MIYDNEKNYTYKEFSMFIFAKAKLIQPNRRSGSNFVCPASMQCIAASANLPILVNSPHIKLTTSTLLLIPKKRNKNTNSDFDFFLGIFFGFFLSLFPISAFVFFFRIS